MERLYICHVNEDWQSDTVTKESHEFLQQGDNKRERDSIKRKAMEKLICSLSRNRKHFNMKTSPEPAHPPHAVCIPHNFANPA